MSTPRGWGQWPDQIQRALADGLKSVHAETEGAVEALQRVKRAANARTVFWTLGVTVIALETSWSAAHERYLAQVSFEHPAQDIAFTEYRQAVSEGEARVQRLSESLAREVEHWRMHSLVSALMTLRGLDLVAAITVVAELGDLRRFAHPRR